MTFCLFSSQTQIVHSRVWRPLMLPSTNGKTSGNPPALSSPYILSFHLPTSDYFQSKSASLGPGKEFILEEKINIHKCICVYKLHLNYYLLVDWKDKGFRS